MELTINSVAKISGQSTRTLRYYDELGLLKPARISSNGYRIYGSKELDLLQQILFYKELDFSLEEISKLLHKKDFDFKSALLSHRISIIERRERLFILLQTVEKTIRSLEGEIEMSEEDKFEGFKKKQLDENEAKFGNEIREKYGSEAVENSNKQLMSMTKEDWSKIEEYNKQFADLLINAMKSGDTGSEIAEEMVVAHKKAIGFFADYSQEAYLGLTQMYCDDERFKEYYEKIQLGGAEFLRDAAKLYCEKGKY